MTKAQAVKNFIKGNYLALTLALIPFLYLLAFISNYSVNTPFWDQWELVPIFKHLNDGQYIFNDFWQQHNEHRLFFPRIVMAVEAMFTNWNTRAEIFTNALLALSSFSLLVAAIRISFRKSISKLHAGLLLIVSLVWFSPLQQENWLWGWQIQWFLNVLGVVTVILGIAWIAQKGFSWRRALLLIFGAIIAEFSLGNGILLWPLIIFALLYLEIPLRKTLVMGGIALLMVALYYVGYENPAGPSKTLALSQPIKFAEYLLNYLGRPLAESHYLAPIFGLIILAVFCGLIVTMFYKYKKHMINILPFIVLGSYAICSGILTTLSRLGFGIEQARSSRYTTISSLLLVATILITFYFFAYAIRTKKDSSIKKYVPICLLAAVAPLIITNAISMSGAVKTLSQYRRDIQSCTRLPQPDDVCLRSTYPNETIVEPRLKYLKQIHWSGY